MTTIRPTLESDDELLTPNARRLVSDKTGIVQKMFRSRLDSRDDPRIHFTTVEEANFDPLVDGKVKSFRAGGKELVERDSALAALGEAVERYCYHLSTLPPDTEATYDELVESGERVVDYAYLDIWEDDQYDFPGLSGSPFTRSSTVQWTSGTDLLTGESVYLPTQMLHTVQDRRYPIYFMATSNGAATGTSLRMALENGITEAFERDGFMRAWCTQTAPSRVDLRNFPEIRELKASMFEQANLEFHLLQYDSPTDVASIGCAVVNGREERPNFLIGGGAGLSTKDALADALVEGAQCWHSQKLDDFVEEDTSADEFVDLNDGVKHYADPEMFEEVSFLLEGETVAPEPTADGSSGDLETLLAELDEAGMTPIAFDLTRQDVREVGWRVAKVFVPELVPLTAPGHMPRDHPAFDGVEITDKPHPYP